MTIQAGLILAAALLLSGGGFYLGTLRGKSQLEQLQASQFKALADAYQAQVLARQQSETKLQTVENQYDAIKDIPDPATVGTARRLLIVAAACPDVPQGATVAGGTENAAAITLGPSPIERALDAYVQACSADAKQLAAMIELAP